MIDAVTQKYFESFIRVGPDPRDHAATPDRMSAS